MNKYTITFFSQEIENSILRLPKTLRAKCFNYLDVMIDDGPNLGIPHTKAMGNRLFELRLKAQEGIARVILL